MERVYLDEDVPNLEMRSNLDTPKDSKFIQATILVNKFIFHKYQYMNQNTDLHSSKKNFRGTIWINILEPGI
jgi:hypothetical protein